VWAGGKIHQRRDNNCDRVLRGSTGLGAAEAGSGVVDLIIASGRELMRLQWHMTGKHSHSELKLP